MEMKFKYVIKGDSSVNILPKVNRKCLSLREAENVKNGLEAAGYKVEIRAITDQSLRIIKGGK